jgi:hypothetical protein
MKPSERLHNLQEVFAHEGDDVQAHIQNALGVEWKFPLLTDVPNPDVVGMTADSFQDPEDAAAFTLACTLGFLDLLNFAEDGEGGYKISKGVVWQRIS